MPTYDFYCKTCDKTIELIVFYRDFNEIQRCEDCYTQLDRVIPVVPAHFKGDGWGAQ